MPTDPAERELRDTRGKSFNFPFSEPLDQDDPNSGDKVLTVELRPLPELPVDQAEAIALGKITAIQPYLSQDHKAIYSEYSVQVEKIVDQQLSAITTSDPLVIDQVGGAVTLPGGKTVQEQVDGIGLPVSVGGRYLFFITHVAQGNYYQIVKLWELRDGLVRVMGPDDLGRSAHHASHYDGMKEESFLSVVNGLKATRKTK